mgnify:FL=1
MFGNILETLGLRAPDRTPPPAAMSYGQARAQIGPSSDPLTRVDPNDFINGPQDARPAPQAVTQEGPMPTNILQSLDQTPPEMMQPQAEAPRKRLSLIDTVGRISDVIANVGGSQAQYQPYLDAREDRALGMEDRERQIDLDALRKRVTEQQLETGQMGIEGDERARLGQALGAIADDPEAIASWPQIAQQAGISAERTAQVGEILAKNPKAAATFAESLGYTAPKPASQAKELQVYGLLQSKDPKLAEVYLQSISNPDSITPYQQAQLALSMEKFGFEKYKFENPQPTAAMRTAEAKGASGSNAMQGALDNLDELSTVYDDLNEIGGLVSSKKSTVDNVITRSRASGVGQLIEGAVGTEAQTLRDRIASIRPALMQSIAKATGMTGKQLDSNADVKLFMQTVTDPTASYEANKRAIEGLKRFIRNSAPKPAAQPARAAKPRYQPSPNRKPVPAPSNANPALLAEARRRGLVK